MPSPAPHSQPRQAIGDAGRHFARLRHLQRTAAELAGRDLPRTGEDEAERIAKAYACANPAAQRRFDVMMLEISAWAAAGADALARLADPAPSAAWMLADSIDEALERLARRL